MSNRAAESWDERAERTFALSPPPRRSRARNLIHPFIYVVGTAAGVLAAVYAKDDGQRLFWASMATLQILISTRYAAEALHAGAFEGRFTDWGRKLRIVEYFLTLLAGIFMFTAAGYMFWSSSGAFVGLALGVALSVLGIFYDLRRGRRQAVESAHSEPA